MWFVGQDELEQNNKKLRDSLGLTEGSELILKDGFMLCPDDNINRASTIPKLIEKSRTIVSLFQNSKKYKPVFNAVMTHWSQTDKRLNILNYTEFKKMVKLSHFLAAAYYIFWNQIRLAPKKGAYLGPLYKPGSEGALDDITKNIDSYLTKFKSLFGTTRQQLTNKNFFEFAKKVIVKTQTTTETRKKERVAKLLEPLSEEELKLYALIFTNKKEKTTFQDLDTFFTVGERYPYGSVTGGGWEGSVAETKPLNHTKTEIDARIEEEFEQLNVKGTAHLATLLAARFKEYGVLISLDTYDPFRKSAAKNAKGLKVPDYIFVTKKYILPIDIKANLDFVHPEVPAQISARLLIPKQISASNLLQLINKMPIEFGKMFHGFSINGKQIARAEEKTKTKKATPQYDMKSLSTELRLQYPKRFGQILGALKKDNPGQELGKMGFGKEIGKIMGLMNKHRK